ncbi:MAG: hypothetical protein COX20_13580 [Desulfobacterales bacterium CG23_combo_of_CG06-09_8_20_14_all_52_9]|nr:MAG: hypothetical protein COX20_13580 [Desulfobacterales bacterium CG23_combo_of_CG06-09_8_20_14_all_52_9]
MKKARFIYGSIWIIFFLLFLFVAGCSKKVPPKTADQVVKDVAQGLAAHQPQVLWGALPASYQKDIHGLVHDFAAKTDKELWNKSFALFNKVLLVLKTKKNLLMAGKMLNDAPIDAKKLSDNWDGVLGMAEVITKSELADLEKLKHLDVGKFLSGTGADLIKRLDALSKLEKDEKFATAFTQLKTVNTTVIQSQKDAATVKIEVPKEVSWEIAFVKVEEKWVPKSLADQWKTEIEKAKKELAEFSTTFTAEEKQRVLGVMTSIDGILDQMLAAKTVKELESTLGQALGMVLGMALGKG